MKRYSFRDTAGFRCLFGLYMLGLLLLTRDSMYGLLVFGFVPSQIALGAMTVLGAGLFLWVQRKQLQEIFRDSRIPAAVILAALVLIPMLVKRDWQLMYLSILMCLLIAVFIHYFLDIRTASRYYLVILSVLGVWSILCTYFLRILPDRGILPVPVVENSHGFHFYQMGLAVVSLDFVQTRNFGIFREPGVYQFFLLLGLYLNNYQADWEKPWQLWTVNGILALTTLSTFATGGIIELGLLVIFLFWDKKWYRSRKARMLAYALVLALAGVIAWVLITKNALYMDLVGVFGKFNSSNETGTSRLESIFTDLDIFLHHPLVGAKLAEVLHAVENNTTSTMIQYAVFGLITGSLHVAAWGAMVWDRKRPVIGNLILLLILFMAFNTQNLMANPIFWLFPLMGLLDTVLPWWEGRRKKV